MTVLTSASWRSDFDVFVEMGSHVIPHLTSTSNINVEASISRMIFTIPMCLNFS